VKLCLKITQPTTIPELALRDCHEATRDALVGLLWSESSHARGRASLRQSVYEIRTALMLAGGCALEADKDVLRLPANGMVVDVLDAIRLASEGAVHPTLFSRQRVIDSMLIDLESVDPVFREWVFAQRHVAQERWLRTLSTMCNERLARNIGETSCKLYSISIRRMRQQQGS